MKIHGEFRRPSLHSLRTSAEKLFGATVSRGLALQNFADHQMRSSVKKLSSSSLEEVVNS